MEVVKNIPRLHDELVFPADSGNGAMRTDSISKALNRFCQHTGMEPFQPRDLRTTFKTLTGEIGISKEIRDRIQNHAFSDVSSKHYDRYEYLVEKRTALKRWGRYLEQIINGQFAKVGDNVIPIRKSL
jgi:integrase